MASDEEDLAGGSMHKRWLVVVVAMVAGLGIVGSSLGANPTYVAKNCLKPKMKPGKILIACGDGNGYVKVDNYRYWNGREAGGNGKFFVNDCMPSCAEGTFRSYSVSFRLTKPRKRTCGGERGVRLFQVIKVDWKNGRPSGLADKYDLFCIP